MEGHHLACGDTLSCYISVHEALGKLPKCGTALGDVINGAVADESTSAKPAAKPTKLSAWGHTMGALYDNYVTYSAFAVGGQERYSSFPVRDGTMTAQLQVVKDGAVVKAWTLNKPLPVDELLPYCTAGDATMRSAAPGAVELPSEEFAALRGGAAAAKPGVTFRLERAELAMDGSCKRVFYPPSFVYSVQQAVRNKLVWDNFTLVPYKLNVCGAGGAVKPHMDAPIVDATRMVGTVVVSLPSKFKGGALHVRAPSSTAPTLIPGAAGSAAGGGGGGGAAAAAAAAAASGGGSSGTVIKRHRDGTAAVSGAGAGSAAVGEECTFNWASASASTDAVQWAAYFGDCMHEVKPVTAGHRVTVTFAIVLTDGTTDDDVKTASRHSYWRNQAELSVVAPSPSVSALHLSRFVAHAVTCPVPTFGILLTEKYTFTAIAPASLKGVDRVLYNALARTGLRVTLRPVVYSMYTTTPAFCAHRDGKRAYATNIVYAFDAAEVARICAASTGGAKPTNTPFVLCSAAKSGLRGDEPVGVCLHHSYSTEDEWYTSGENHKLFFAVALVVSK